MNEPRPDLPSLSRLPPPSQQDSGLLLSLGHLFPVDMEDGVMQSLVLGGAMAMSRERVQPASLPGAPSRAVASSEPQRAKTPKARSPEGQDCNDSTLPWALPSAEGKQWQ